VGNAGACGQPIVADLGLQFGDPGGAAGTVQASPRGCRSAIGRCTRVHGYTAGVVTPVFQALQALHQHRDDVARGHRADDSAHVLTPIRSEYGAMLLPGKRNMHPLYIQF